jgi:TonB family protein
MVMRAIFYHYAVTVLLVTASVMHADPTPAEKPARGTLEYAKTHVIFAPPPQLSEEVRAKRLHGKGLFLLSVRPDGTVSEVRPLQSTGHPELDAASISAFLRWRFYHGTVTAVKVPISYADHFTK